MPPVYEASYQGLVCCAVHKVAEQPNAEPHKHRLSVGARGADTGRGGSGWGSQDLGAGKGGGGGWVREQSKGIETNDGISRKREVFGNSVGLGGAQQFSER